MIWLSVVSLQFFIPVSYTHLEWLQFDDKGQLVQDDASFTQHIKDFVAQLASEHDTVGTTRSFNTTSGRTVSVYGSAYGWQIDQDAEAAQLTEEIRTGTQTTREPVYLSLIHIYNRSYRSYLSEVRSRKNG